ncbi:MAG: hypothetical protein ABI295_02400 [Xanthomarina sp.]
MKPQKDDIVNLDPIFKGIEDLLTRKVLIKNPFRKKTIHSDQVFRSTVFCSFLDSLPDLVNSATLVEDLRSWNDLIRTELIQAHNDGIKFASGESIKNSLVHSRNWFNSTYTINNHAEDQDDFTKGLNKMFPK